MRKSSHIFLLELWRPENEVVNTYFQFIYIILYTLRKYVILCIFWVRLNGMSNRLFFYRINSQWTIMRIHLKMRTITHLVYSSWITVLLVQLVQLKRTDLIHRSNDRIHSFSFRNKDSLLLFVFVSRTTFYP